MGLRESFDRAQPNTLADQFRLIQLGQTLRQDLKATLRALDPDVAGNQAEDLATLDSIQLPNDAKAGVIHRAFARAGGVAVGELTVAARHATPATTEVGIGPSGNIVFLASDAYTDVDVEYTSERGDIVVTADLPVAANVLTLPTALIGRTLVLMEANSIVGGVTGRLIILTPGTGAPAAGQARLNFLGTTVTFAGADAVTSARLTLLVNAAADLNALLEDDDSETL